MAVTDVAPSARQALIVGDIHGCFQELLDLLDVAGLPEDGALVAVGDLVGRGPAPAEVVRLFRERPGALSVQGNHEREHLLAAEGRWRPNRSERILRAQVDPETYGAMLAFFATLPLSLDLGGVRVVHGGWLPGLSLAQQPPDVITGCAGGDTHLAALPAPWPTLYDGDLPLVVGHRDLRRDGQPSVWGDRVFNLDTSCARGGRLTGLLLPGFRIVSVPSRGDHWKAVKRSFR